MTSQTKRKLPSTPVGRRRLLKLADLLEADAKNKKGIKFDLGMWGLADDETKPVSCGTTACAIGLAVASGAFKSDGLSSRNDFDLTPRFAGKQSWDAVQALFSLGHREASFLFMDTFYSADLRAGAAAEREVAKRIRDFVAGKTHPAA